MELQKVNSKTISEMGYDLEGSFMHVRFSSGALYQYNNISHEEFLSIKNDASVGSKLRSVTKDKEYKKI